jgi:hypothetical protein
MFLTVDVLGHKVDVFVVDVLEVDVLEVDVLEVDVLEVDQMGRPALLDEVCICRCFSSGD